MTRPKLTRPELQLMEVLWTRGACSVREIHEGLPARGRPAFTTVQTMIYRLEAKQAVTRVKRIGKANIFEAAVSRDEAHGRLLDEFLAIFGGRTRMVMSHLIGSGRLTLEDIKEAEQELRALSRRDRKS
ncbi:MAG TPA: BlaI/MecI/CopY family transcriptional regulator [Vicinamibacterales bacterium]|jgi:BlaI family transcriptional regulator, penicillinase repressor|nr:BlaI/MecI/CopY family transcriptional regulator [Vicinamibacterales bacterium]